MRILTADKELGLEEVVEIIEIGYDNTEAIESLYFIDKRNNYCYIHGITKEQCNEICRIALIKGYVDLTPYGKYEIELDD